MTDLEKGMHLFQKAGLAFPTIPEPLAGRLKQQGPWVFSTRAVNVSPYKIRRYVHEVEQDQVDDYAVVAHSGHGVNSHAVQYYLVWRSLQVFIHLGWGGVYMDPKTSAEQIRECFTMAERVVTATQMTDKLQAGERLTILACDSYPSYWSLTEAGKLNGATRKSSFRYKPLDALAEALDWVINY